MKLFKSISVFIIAALLFISCSPVSEITSKDSESEPVNLIEETKIFISFDDYDQSKSETETYLAKLPRFKNEKGEPVLRELELQIKADILEEFLAFSGGSPESYVEFTVNSNYAKKNLLSIAYKEFYYSGGAHGGTLFKTYNFDLQNGTETCLSFSDIVNHPESDLEKLGGLASEYVKTWECYQPSDDNHEEINAKNAIMKSSEESTGCSFSFTEEGLFLMYNDYVIGFYADGAAEFTIPYTELKEILKPEYLPE